MSQRPHRYESIRATEPREATGPLPRTRRRAPIPSKSRPAALLLVLSIASLGACSRDQLGLPRHPIEVASPDGQTLAFVKNHLSIDPPDQSLWVQLADGSKKQIRKLAPDQDWCDTIAWSADGSTIAFLVQDARLLVADARTAEVVAESWLVTEDGYPTSEIAADLELSNDGSLATFRRCRRSSSECSGVERVEIPRVSAKRESSWR